VSDETFWHPPTFKLGSLALQWWTSVYRYSLLCFCNTYLTLLPFHRFQTLVHYFRTMVGAICEDAFREVSGESGVHGAVFVGNHLLQNNPIFFYPSQQLIQHVRLRTTRSSTPVVAWSPLRAMSKICNFPTCIVMHSCRATVRVVAPGQVEPIKLCRPLIKVPTIFKFLFLPDHRTTQRALSHASLNFALCGSTECWNKGG